MSFAFVGKKVLVTGAGKGIGRAVAKELSKNGCKVYALSRTRSTLDTLVEEHPSIVPITVDLCDWDNTRNALEKLEVLNGLVNNAGIGGVDYAAVDTPKDYINKTLDNNLLSAINCTQVVASKMIEKKVKGSIVNVSSFTSMVSCPNSFSYCLSKAGLDMVSKQFALELGPHEIRVNSVNPGLAMTLLVKSALKDKRKDVLSVDEIAARASMGRILEVGEIVGPILYLLSDYSKMVTGTQHIVDGGSLSNLSVKKSQ